MERDVVVACYDLGTRCASSEITRIDRPDTAQTQPFSEMLYLPYPYLSEINVRVAVHWKSFIPLDLAMPD